MNQPILLYRSGSVYANETAAWAALDAVTHKKGQPIVAFYTLSSPVSGHHGSSTIGAIFAIGIGDGVGQYKACTSHDDMLIVAQSLNAHITQFNQMFEYDATNNAIKAKLDFYTTDGKSISAGGIGSGSSASLGALYQLVDVMANSSNTGVEGAVEGSVLAYDATAGKWKAIAQSEILPDMSGYYTKDETDSAINTAKSNLQGQVDTLKALIPATATADNQLADKDFVNSSIATATAEFRGSFTSLDELKATSGNLNDYAFYLHNDSVGNSIVDRYKWTTAGWLYEYTLNNSSFTAEQWAALNSAITATLVQSYNSHLNNSTIHITSAERTAWNSKWDYDEETIKRVKVNAAVNADKLATARKIWGRYFDGSDDVSGDLEYVGNITASGKATIQGDIVCGGEVVAVAGEGTPAGVTDYSALTGKPSINGVTLVSGNNTLAALGIQAAGDYATISGVTALLADYATKTFVSNNYVGKTAFNSHTADTDIHITTAERAAWNAKWDYNEATIKAVKVTSASSADSVAWSGIKDKPTTFTPSTHTHYFIVTEGDNRNVATTPDDYYNSFIFKGLKYNSTIGSPSSDMYSYLIGLSGWIDSSGGNTHELAFNNSGIFRRQSSTTEWDSWYQLIDTGNFTKSLVEGVLTGDITSHTHTFASLTSKPTTLSGYGITNAISTSGGTIEGNFGALVVKRNKSYASGIRFDNNDGVLGYIGIVQGGIAQIWDASQNAVQIIHSGNIGSQSVNYATSASNADTLDGYHETGFYRAARQYISSGDIATLEAGSYYNGDTLGDINPLPHIYSSLSVLGKSFYSQQLCVTFDATRAWLRGIINSTTTTVSAWHELAFTDSNVASATKLATPRTIWGQSFDGTGNIDGCLSLNYSSITRATGIEISSTNGGESSIGFRLNPYTRWVIGCWSNALNIWRENYGNVLSIPSTNNVLIGTTTDNGYKLQVNGSERVYGDLIVDGEVSALVA